MLLNLAAVVLFDFKEGRVDHLFVLLNESQVVSNLVAQLQMQLRNFLLDQLMQVLHSVLERVLEPLGQESHFVVEVQDVVGINTVDVELQLVAKSSRVAITHRLHLHQLGLLLGLFLLMLYLLGGVFDCLGLDRGQRWLT